MKRKILVSAIIAAVAFPAMAADEASPEKGKELFSSQELGTNGRSCATCHPGGKGLEKAGGYTEGELAEIVNQCIKKPLQGKGLDLGSGEMRSLVAYIKTLSSGEQK